MRACVRGCSVCVRARACVFVRACMRVSFFFGGGGGPGRLIFWATLRRLRSAVKMSTVILYLHRSFEVSRRRTSSAGMPRFRYMDTWPSAGQTWTI